MSCLLAVRAVRVGAMLLLIGAGAAVGRAEGPSAEGIPEAQPEAQGIGQLLIHDAQSGAWRRLSVARYHVNVVLHAPVALVQIDQTFYNPYGQQEEGTFVFNLPPGASVSRFAMYVTPTELIEGELVERGRASSIYESIVRTKRDPAILEQIGDNLFRMRVFPVPAQGVKQILLDFTVPLDPEPDGTCRFELPLLSDLEPIWDFRIGGRIFGPVPGASIDSPWYPDLALGDPLPPPAPGDPDREAEGAFGGLSVPFEYSRRDYQPHRPFVLKFRHAPEEPAAMQLYRAEPLVTGWRRGQEPADPDSRYPMTYFRIELRDPEIDRREPQPLDLLVLADTSAAVRGRREVAEAVERLLEHLRPEDRVRLVCVDVAARPMHEGWLAPESDELQDARERFAEEFSLGGADLAGSFREALKSFGPADAARRRMVVYAGSGEDTMGPVPSAELQEALARMLRGAAAPLMAMYVPGPRLPQLEATDAEPAGPASASRLLETVSAATGGLMWDAWDASSQRTYQRWLAMGMPAPLPVSDVGVADAKPDDLFFPTAWTPGEPFVILGRLPTAFAQEEFEVVVTSLRDGEPVELRRQLHPEEHHDNVLIGRLWAQRKLSELALALPVLPRPESAEYRRVVALSREWSVLSPLTAFLVLESERDYRRWGISRLRRRYWRPPGAADDAPLPPEWIARVLAARGLKADPPREPGAPPLPDPDTASPRRRTADWDPWRRPIDGLRDRQWGDGLGWQRRLFAPLAEAPPPVRPSLAPLLHAPAEAGDDYARLFPNYRALLTPVDISMPVFTLREFADWLKHRTSVHVEVDRRALHDVGLDPDMTIDPEPFALGRGEVSLHNYIRHVLSRFGLTVISERNHLAITTPEEAEARLRTEVYPVADLIVPGHPTPPHLLADPLFDLETAAQKRIRRHLRRPISVQAEKLALYEVLLDVADQLDIPLVIDDRSLEDVGLGRLMPVSIQCEDLPGEEVLTIISRDYGLSCTVRDEALVVTTPEEFVNSLTVRLHSVRGVAYEYPDSQPEAGALSAWFPGSGGMGGMAAAAGFGQAPGGGGLGAGVGGFVSGFPFTPRRAREAPRGHAALSTGGELALAPAEPPAASEPEPDDEPDVEPDVEVIPDRSRDARPDRAPATLVYKTDYDSIIDTLTGSVAPHSWDHVGGPGTIVPFPYTLDLIVLQCERIHEQLEALLDQLRGMPPAFPGHWAMRPARLPHPMEPVDFELDTFIEAITFSVRPQTWEDVGGPGSIEPDFPRAALVVLQTQDVHIQLRQLLTQLRRSRYAQLRPDRPWEQGVGPLQPRVDPWGLGTAADRLSLGKLPEPKPAELAALAWRRMPERGRWVWRRVTPDGEEVETITVVRDGERLEVRLPECGVRIEGEEVAVAWPELGLVELGPWAEAVRHVLDGRLPWLPHRANEHLARWYDVLPAERDGRGARLVPPGYHPHDGTYLLVEPSGSEHLPARITSYFEVERTGLLRWSENDADGPAIIWADASGQPLSRWELVEYTAEAGPVPAPGAPREGFVHLDRRGDEPELDPGFARALDDIENRRWPEATARLAQAAERTPEHPLLAVLRAWCHDQAPHLEPRDDRLKELHAAAAAGQPLVFRWLAEGHPGWLRARERHGILGAYPEELQTWDHLHARMRLAIQMRQHAEALALLDRAVEAGMAAADREARFEQYRLRVKLLPEVGRADEAVDEAWQWAARADAAPGEVAALAEHVAAGGRRAAAAELLAHAAKADLPDEQRAHMLRRLADLHEGLPRWERLIEAADLLPDDSPLRRQWLDALLADLEGPIHAGIPARLAEKTRDEALQVRLRLLYADLLVDPRAAGNVYWELAEAGRLPADRMPWAMSLWNRARQPERTIAACEHDLRRGRALDSQALHALAVAYRDTGRHLDARRAETEP